MRVVVVGGGVVGMRASVTVKHFSPDAEIVLIEKTDIASWAGCTIPYYISGKLPLSTVVLDTPESIKQRGIKLYTNHIAEEIDFDNRRVKVFGDDIKGWIDYDWIVLGMGAVPRKIPVVDEIEAENKFHISHAKDGIKLKKYIEENKPRKALIIGAGYIGIEMAENLYELGMEVTVVEKLTDIFPRFPELMRKKIKKVFEEKGIELYTDTVVEEVETKDKKIVGVKLSNGARKETDLVLVAVGVKPNTDILKGSKVMFGECGGVKINEYAEVEGVDRAIAGGDLVCVKNLITGKEMYYPLGDIANKHGLIGGRTIVGKRDVKFKGAIGSNITKFFVYQISSAGLNLEEAKSAGFNAKSMDVKGFTGNHKFPDTSTIDVHIVYDDDTKRILGVFLLGEKCVASFTDVFSSFISNGLGLEEILNTDFAYAPPTSVVWNPALLFVRKILEKV